MTSAASRPRVVSPVAVLALCCVLFLSGCAMLRGPRPAPPPPSPERSLARQADQAFTGGNHAESARLYAQLVDQPGLDPQIRAQAWERLVTSSLEQRQFEQVIAYLPRWRRAVPGIETGNAWPDSYFRAVAGLTDPAQQELEYLALAGDEQLPWTVRTRARVGLAALVWSKGDILRAQSLLEPLPAQARDAGPAAPGQLEGFLLDALPPVPLPHLDSFERLVPETARNLFPVTIIQLEKGRRLAANPQTRAQAYSLLQRVGPFLADPSLVQKVLGARETAPRGDQALALALPLTGPYAEVAGKIMRGAMAAQKDLDALGSAVDVQVINTDAATWQEDLANLPPNVVLVGGPLQVDFWRRLQGTQLPRQRAFFAFLPGLGSSQEGQDAWRFFPSAQDQINTLVNAALSRGLSTTTVLYPEDSYGMHMAQLFRQEAMGKRLAVLPSQGYPVQNSENWGEIARRSVLSGAGAVFIPGDWAHAEMLVPYLIYHEGQDMLLMGPSLWGAGIDRKQYVEMPAFQNAVFPGAWWPESESMAALSLQRRLQTEGQPPADFWTALGYDFVRFAVALGPLPETWTPGQINASLAGLAGLDWSMAPLRWNNSGVATQDLFLFRPTEHGYTLFGMEPVSSPQAPTPVQENEVLFQDLSNTPLPAE